MLWLVLAAQLSAPIPTNFNQWFTPADVPIEELTLERPTVVPFRVTVAPSGQVQACEVEIGSGIADVDDLTCELVRKRAKFRPATDANGRPAYGVYRSFARWLITEQPQMPGPVTTSDLEVSVAQLPSGVRSPAAVKVMFAVDRMGRASSCVGERAQDHPALVKVACSQFVEHLRPRPATTAEGAAVDSVQNGTVLLVRN